MPSIPQRIGNFLLKRELGRGGMGTVFLAIQEGLEREVALKLLTAPSMLAGDEAARRVRRRFLREAALCSRLSHPNIVTLFDYGCEDDVPFLAMELLRGRSLEAILKEAPVQPVPFIVEVAQALASALEHYLPLGIVHRDLKPANVMVEPSGRIVLTDFGLARAVDSTQLTAAGAAVGTPYYVAPEVVRGQQADGASDLYQVGVLLYRMATGQLPFTGQGIVEIFRAIVLNALVPPRSLVPELPPALENLILNCLARDRACRYQTASALAADVNAVRCGRSVERLVPDAAPPAVRVQAAVASRRPDPHAPEPVAPPRAASAPSTGSPARPSRGSVEAARASRPGAPAAVVLAGAALLAVLALALGVRDRMPSPSPATLDVRVKAGSRRAIVKWNSPTPCASRVEWRREDNRGHWSAVDADPAATRTEHRIFLEGLLAGTSYRLRVRNAGGGWSLEHSFATQSVAPQPEDLVLAEDRFELVFTTSVPVVATLRAGSRESREAQASRRHEFSMPAVDLASGPLELVCSDALGDETRYGAAEVAHLLRETLVPRLVGRLAREAASFEPGRLLASIDRRLPATACLDASSAVDWEHPEDELIGGHGKRQIKEEGPEKARYWPFPRGDPGAARLAGELLEQVRILPYWRSLQTLRRLTPSGLAGTSLPLAVARDLLRGLEPARLLEAYCDVLDLPFETGVRDLLGPRYLAGRVLQSRQSRVLLETALSGSQSFVHPWREYQTLNLGLGGSPSSEEPIGAFEWRPTLPPTDGLREVELALVGVRLEPQLVYRVRLNGELTLHFYRLRSEMKLSKNHSFALWTMTFDPRFLRAGLNRIEVAIDSIPGTRHLGLQRRNRLTRLQLRAF